MNTEGVFRPTLFQFAQEDDFSVHLLHTHVEVADALEALLHLVQLMIVGGEECPRLGLAVLVQILHDGPGDGDAVVGAGAPSQFVEEHEGARRHIVEDIRSLGHLHHESGFAEGDIVAGTHTGEYFVHQTDSRALCGHKAAHLGHEYHECRLTQQRRFSGHIRSGDDHDLLRLIVEQDAVGHIALAHGHLGLDDGVSSLPDIEHRGGIDNGPHIMVLLSRLGKGEQTVEPGHEVGVDLYLGDKLLYGGHQVGKEPCFQSEDAVFGSENLLLILLQFLGDIAFGLCEGLLAHPVGGHLVLVRVPHFEIIAEHIVVANLQAGDTRLFDFPLLDLEQVVLAAVGYLAQLVELIVHPTLDHVALAHHLRRVFVHLASDAVAHTLAERELLPYPFQHRIVGRGTGLLHGNDGHEGILQLHHLAGCHPSHRHLRGDALQVSDAVELLVETGAEIGMTEEMVHHIETLADGFLLFEGEDEPAAQQASAHGRDGMVDDREQGGSVLLHRLHQFETTYGEVVHAHVAVGLNA